MMNDYDYERYVFRLIKQEPGESFNSFLERIENQIHKCGFFDVVTHFKSQIIEKCSMNELRRKAFQNEMTLDHLIFTGRILEEAERNCMKERRIKYEERSISVSPTRLRQMRRESFEYERRRSPQNWNSVSTHHRQSSYSYRKSPSLPRQERSRIRNRSPLLSPKPELKLKCTRCGLHDQSDKTCPSVSYRCNICHKRGHFEKFCFHKDFVKSEKLRKLRLEAKDSSSISPKKPTQKLDIKERLGKRLKDRLGQKAQRPKPKLSLSRSVRSISAETVLNATTENAKLAKRVGKR